MRVYGTVLATLCVSSLLVLVSVPANSAETPMVLMGSWVEKGEQGAMQWDVGPDSISVVPLDAAGKPLAEPSRIDVLYQRSGKGWAVVVRAPDGSAVDEGRAEVKDGTMLLLLPAIGSHELKRK